MVVRIMTTQTHDAAKTNCTWVASSTDLIGGCDVWCGWFVNLECNCKCDNMIAMVLQCVRSVLLWLLCVKIDMQCRHFGLWYLLCAFYLIVLLDCCKRLFV